MASGLEIRAQIDAETARGLIQINGGGAVAILALLPSILNHTAYGKMAIPLLSAVILFALGLVLAVVHNQLRRQCSLRYEAHQYSPPGGRIFSFQLKRPTVCFCGLACMWSSIIAFVIAVLVAAIGVYSVSGGHQTVRQWPPCLVELGAERRGGGDGGADDNCSI